MQQTPAFSSVSFPELQWQPPKEHAQAMNAMKPAPAPWVPHQLYFASLFRPGRALAFACDQRGEVQLDSLSERARSNYFFARAAVGRDYGVPIVIALETGSTH